MKRLEALAVLLVLTGCGSSSDNGEKAEKGCPRGAPTDASYSVAFEGPVGKDQREHVLRLTHSGRPVGGAQVCVNAQMVGMAGMRYSARASELAPGRYRLGLRFGMDGTYRGNVVTRRGGKEASVPVTVRVGPGAMQGMAPIGRGADGTSASAGGLTLKLAPRTAPAGRPTVWTIRVVDRRGKPVRRFDREQTKLMHLIVVRDDFTHYQHLHPVLRAGGPFTLPVTLPAPGRYRAIADFTTMGTRYPLGVTVTAPGKARLAPLPPPRPTAKVDGYAVRLSHESLTAGSAAPLEFRVLRSGRPVTKLQPYLGAFGHLVALRRPDLAYSHVHPIAHDARAGTIRFHAELPSAATYRLFLQFRAAGAVHTAPFTVVVRK